MFDLDEYKAATDRFFADAVLAVARADGLLAQIRFENVESLVPSQNTLADGQVVSTTPAAASSTLTFSVPEGVAGSFDDLHAAIAQAAEDYRRQIVPQMLEHITQICDATGNVVDGAGLSMWDAQLEALETIELSFDADGNPSLPSLAMNPETIAQVGDPPPDFQQRFDAIITRRRDEWLAGRRTRRLPRHRR